MNSFVEQALTAFCSNHSHLFGRSSTYERFDETPASNPGDGANSETLFGRLVYRTATGALQSSPPIMLKLMPSSFKFRTSALEDFFSELFFYTRALPIFQQLGDLRPLLPTFYDSHIQIGTTASNFLLVFEDLRHRGFRTHERQSFLDVDHLALMLRQLGRFHSFSYRAKQTNPQQLHSLGRLFCGKLDELPDEKWLQQFCQRGLQRLRQDSRYRHRMAQVEEAIADADQLMDRLNRSQPDQPLAVLCHGDFLRGNVLFRYENGKPVEMKMIDMASCRVNSPVVDLSTVLYLNADQRTRDEHWDHLIDAYCVGLQEEFGSEGMPSRHSIEDAFRGRALYGYFIASYFLGCTMAADAGLPSIFELLPKECAGKNFIEISTEARNQAIQLIGGEECTVALADILRDIIDRDFVCAADEIVR